MTIAVQTGRWRYVGNGATTTFPYAAKVHLDTDLRVEIDDVLQTAGYLVTGVGNASGGNVVFELPPASLAIVVITIAPPILQSTDLAAPIDVDATETQFDKTTNILKMLAEKLARALKLKGSSLFTELTLPDPQAARFLRWKPDLSGIENADVGGAGNIGIPVSVAEGGTGAGNALDARANLGVPLDNIQITGGSITNITDIAIADGGTGASTPQNARVNLFVAPRDPTYLLLDGSGLGASEVPNGRVLTPGTHMQFTDDGPGNALTINASMPRGYLAGLKLSNNAGDPTNDIDIAAGACRAADNTTDLFLASALTKQLDADWAAGTNAGMRVGALANGTWHVYLFQRSGGAYDITAEQTLTPVLADGGTKYRRIGSILREGGVIVAFTQYGDEFWRTTPIADLNTTAPATTVQTLALSVPDLITVWALMRWRVSSATLVYVKPTTSADAVPSGAGAPGVSAGNVAGAVSVLRIPTNTSRQINYRASATTGTIMAITDGWLDRRGRDD